MLKEERQNFIIDLLNKNKVIKVGDITDQINVTDMTVRRDLQELEKKNLLVRIHGGAKIVEEDISKFELSHQEKININLEKKQDIAKKISHQINNGETIFFGAGTTIELTYDYLNIDRAKIITNSIHIFNKFKNDRRFELILVGGSYREISGAFVGTIANDFLSSIHVDKAFIGVNGIDEEFIYNSNETEGLTQLYILNNAKDKYIVADSTKFDRKDFYQFYSLVNVDYLITDKTIIPELMNKYKQLVNVIK